MSRSYPPNRAIWMLACSGLALLTGCTTQRVISTERVQVGQILVQSSPSAQVLVNGSPVGWTPVRVPVHRIKHTVEEVRHKGTKHTTTQLLITGFGTLLFPPMGLACGAAFSKKNFDIKREVRHFARWEDTTMGVTLKRDGYRSTRMTVVSNRFPRYWQPTLAALPRKPDPVEQAHQVVRSTRSTSANLGRVMKELDEVIERSYETRKRLLEKKWDASTRE